MSTVMNELDKALIAAGVNRNTTADSAYLNSALIPTIDQAKADAIAAAQADATAKANAAESAAAAYAQAQANAADVSARAYADGVVDAEEARAIADAAAKAEAARVAAVSAAAADATAKANVAATTANWSGVASRPSDLEIYNNQDSIIRAPQGALFTTQLSSIQGSIKIRLPQSWTNTMMKFTVDIYEYLNGYSCSIEISGYNHTGTLWYNVSAKVIGGSNVEYPVYFGHDGTKCCVYIADAGETWTYPQIRVRDFFAGYAGMSKSLWESGWQISISNIGPQSITNQVLDTYPAADWRKTVGPGRPENYATVGANASNLNVGLGVNMLTNSLPNTITDFSCPGGYPIENGGPSLAVTGSGFSIYSPLRQCGFTHLVFPDPQNRPFAPHEIQDTYYRDVNKIPVKGNTRYEFSAFLSRHRCNASLTINWYTAAGAYISGVEGALQIENTSTVNDNNPWTRVVVFADLPADARLVMVAVRMRGNGGVDPYLFYSGLHFGEALPNQTVASAWSDGAPTSVRTIGYTGALDASANITLIGRNVTVQGNTLIKTGGSAGDAWDGDAYSTDSSPFAYATATVSPTGSAGIFFGLNDNPIADMSYGDITFSWYFEATVCYATINYDTTAYVVAYAPGDVFLVTYDGVAARWYKNGNPVRQQVVDIGQVPLYFDSSFVRRGGTLLKCGFGPIASNLFDFIGGANKPQNNATVGAPAGTLVANVDAATVAAGAQAGSTAQAALNNPPVLVGLPSAIEMDGLAVSSQYQNVEILTASTTGGVGPFTYSWTLIVYVGLLKITANSGSQITVQSKSTGNTACSGYLTCTTSGANGITDSYSLYVNTAHGTGVPM